MTQPNTSKIKIDGEEEKLNTWTSFSSLSSFSETDDDEFRLFIFFEEPIASFERFFEDIFTKHFWKLRTYSNVINYGWQISIRKEGLIFDLNFERNFEIGKVFPVSTTQLHLQTGDPRVFVFAYQLSLRFLSYVWISLDPQYITINSDNNHECFGLVRVKHWTRFTFTILFSLFSNFHLKWTKIFTWSDSWE